jgi:hypothetical protein
MSMTTPKARRGRTDPSKERWLATSRVLLVLTLLIVSVQLVLGTWLAIAFSFHRAEWVGALIAAALAIVGPLCSWLAWRSKDARSGTGTRRILLTELVALSLGAPSIVVLLAIVGFSSVV